MMCKEYFERDGRKVCRVTFKLPSTLWVASASLVGDFNDWDRSAHPFLQGQDGSWFVTVELDCGYTYQFCYVADQDTWLAEAQADGAISNPYGGSNSLLVT